MFLFLIGIKHKKSIFYINIKPKQMELEEKNLYLIFNCVFFSTQYRLDKTFYKSSFLLTCFSYSLIIPIAFFMKSSRGTIFN